LDSCASLQPSECVVAHAADARNHPSAWSPLVGQRLRFNREGTTARRALLCDRLAGLRLTERNQDGADLRGPPQIFGSKKFFLISHLESPTVDLTGQSACVMQGSKPLCTATDWPRSGTKSRVWNNRRFIGLIKSREIRQRRWRQN
jgi:hypothetical protein